MANRTVCPACMKKQSGPVEEKCCSHGCAPGITCVDCGRERSANEPSWSCLGTMNSEPRIFRADSPEADVFFESMLRKP